MCGRPFERDWNVKINTFTALKSSAAPFALGLAMLSSPAFAQDAAPGDCAADPSDPACTVGSNEIIVTGSLITQADGETSSPVTTVTAENLDQRGISTVQEGIQALAANNGPALTNSFSANGAFAGGASAVSLRGLSTNSTLVLFDGLRAAYYPLADDATRNFVDLNTIPDDIVDRVEVLRDGASSSYGADAIAGVVNIITKREIQGIKGRAEAGLSERGDGAQYRLSLTAGTGDIAADGYNAYLSGFYFKSDSLYNRDRGYPFNTDDLRNVCSPDGESCGPNNTIGGLDADGIYRGGTPTAGALYVRPYTNTNGTIAGSIYQPLGNLCNGPTYTLTAVDRSQQDSAGNFLNATAPDTVCQVDYTNNYSVINPEIERYGISARVTAAIGDSLEAYGEVNFLQSTVSYTGLPPTIRGNANTGIFFPRFSTSSNAGAVAPGSFALSLPVYVCANGTGDASAVNTGCNAGNGTLNPNNPFAAQGQIARLVGRFLDRPVFNETRNRAYRGAVGIKGDLTDAITLDVAATAMHVDLRRTQKGYVYIQNFLDSIAQGTFNFVDTSANSQDVYDRISPDNVTPASSDQVQFQAILGTKLMELPGGPLQLAVGGSLRYEAVDAPSANSDINGPTQRYFTLNAFGTTGNRWITSGFAELDAPIVDQFTVNLSGRYDHYSSGQDAFSPKVGLKFRPFDSLLIRGTYSRGFRIPSFGEANALPTTGFVTNNASIFNDAYLAQYGCNTGDTSTTNTNGFSTCPVYIRNGSYGQTTLASPDLEPEKSRSFTGGIFFEPVRNFSLSVDYYNIKKTGVITQPSNSPALQAYYTGQAIPDGYTVVADAPDPNFPNARPRIAFIQSQLVNANTQKVSGIDFGINGSIDFSENLRFTSHLEASYILKLETEFPDGTTERYDGTLGNFNLTAGSGTPKWHGYWLNTLEVADAYQLTGTVNYFGKYNLSAVDQGTGYKDCGLNPGYSPSGCDVPEYITFDLQGALKVNDQFTFTLTALNLFDKAPPVDVVTYGAYLYNPVQGGTGILGRYFKAGVKVGF